MKKGVNTGHSDTATGVVGESENDLNSMTIQTEDNSNVQIKPKVAIVDHTPGS